MQGHWIGGTRKLNKHWQSGTPGGGGSEQLVLFDYPQDDPRLSGSVRRQLVAQYQISQGEPHVFKLKLKQKKYVLKWNITPVDSRYLGVIGIGAKNQSGVYNDIVYNAGAVNDQPNPLITNAVANINPDSTINWLTPYQSYSTFISTYKYTENDSSMVMQPVILDFTNVPLSIINSTANIEFYFLVSSVQMSGEPIFYGRCWLEEIITP